MIQDSYSENCQNYRELAKAQNPALSSQKVCAQPFYTNEKITEPDNLKEMLKETVLKTTEDVCGCMDWLMQQTTFNLKRSNSKGNSPSITYVCSCISRKREKFQNPFNSSPSLSPTYQDSQNLYSEMSCNSDYSISSREHKGDARRKIKRLNKDACKFRIKFKWDSQKEVYVIKDDSDLSHNHLPKANLYFQVYRHIRKMDNAIDFKIIEADFLNKLRNKILQMMSQEHRENKILKTNFNKKLSYFIKRLGSEVLSINNNLREIDQSVVIQHLYQFVLKKGANYLRQDSIQVLTSLIKTNSQIRYENFEECFAKNSNDF